MTGWTVLGKVPVGSTVALNEGDALCGFCKNDSICTKHFSEWDQWNKKLILMSMVFYDCAIDMFGCDDFAKHSEEDKS